MRPFIFSLLTCLASSLGFLLASVAVASVPSQVYGAGVRGQGTWEATLQVRDLDGNTANGYEAYYDAALNITWLADANHAKTSGYSSAANGGVDPGVDYSTNAKWVNGRMGWDAARTWAAQLSVGAYSDWRLPNMVDVGNDGCSSLTQSGGVNTDCGYNVDTSLSEMAHMFYVTLGNKGYYAPVTGLGGQSGWGLSNAGPFVNVQSSYYWLGLEYMSNVDGAWGFGSGNGYQDGDDKYHAFYAWAVRSGDVSVVTAVPEPSVCVLLLSCLGLLVATMWRRPQ